MSGTIEYHTETINCPECGEEAQVEVITEVEDGEFYYDIAGYQNCAKCKHQFIQEDLHE